MHHVMKSNVIANKRTKPFQYESKSMAMKYKNSKIVSKLRELHTFWYANGFWLIVYTLFLVSVYFFGEFRCDKFRRLCGLIYSVENCAQFDKMFIVSEVDYYVLLILMKLRFVRMLVISVMEEVASQGFAHVLFGYHSKLCQTTTSLCSFRMQEPEMYKHINLESWLFE